jgi:nitrate/nitrite transporter NarK
MLEDKVAGDDTNTRWWILAFVSLVMLGNYYVYDAVAPLAEQLERELGFSDTEIGALNAIYSLPNIFLVLIGGLIVDRFGASRVTLWTTAICLAGAILTAWQGRPGVCCSVLAPKLCWLQLRSRWESGLLAAG